MENKIEKIMHEFNIAQGEESAVFMSKPGMAGDIVMPSEELFKISEEFKKKLENILLEK